MPEPATLPRSGLFTKADAAVPLAGVSIQADISNLCARVTVAQRFVNRETQPIEAVYLFPLDEGAAVCGFEAVVDGTLVVGEVKPRDEAFEQYDDAMARGDGAFLLDEERPDVFQASVGNLPPGKEAVLRLTYVTELTVDEGSVRFVIPTTVSPRYAPAEDTVGIGRPNADTLNPPAHMSVPYGLELSVRLAMSGPVRRIDSPSHPIGIELHEHGAVVTLSQRDAALDRDFVLALDAASLAEPRAWVERDDQGRAAVAIGFVPDLPQAATPAEVIFVVDRSGSMEGTSIQEVRNALQLCLRSLVPGSRFNIIGFGSSVDALFGEPREYKDSTLRKASEHVAQMDADLGGTEILPALKIALEGSPDAALPRQVVVMTDGEVSNTDAVLALAKSHAAHARIFTFGIGAGASHHLVKGLARAAGGSAEFIYPGERIEPKVLRQFARLLSPALTNVKVDWGGLDVTQAPSAIPPVFAGGRTVLYGFVRETAGAQGAMPVRLTADGPSGPVAFHVPVDLHGAATGATVSTLAARARIRELEESPEWLTSRGSRQQGRKAGGPTREIIELATRYGLVSRETSYVAIERRETPVQGDIQLRRVPIALTTGWGGQRQLLGRAASQHFTGAFRKLEAPQPRASMLAEEASSAFDRLMSWGRRSPSSHDHDVADAAAPLHAWHEIDGEVRRLLALAALQRADGSWEFSRHLAELLGLDPARMEAAAPNVTGAPREARDAWATALALAWLEIHAAERQDEWRLLALKGRAWLDRIAPPLPNRHWMDEAAGFVRRRSA